MVKTQKTAYNNTRGDFIMPTTFNVVIRPAEDVGGYWASCVMPNGGCNTQGDTIREVERTMYDLVADWIENDLPEIKEYFISFEVKDRDIDLEEYNA
jgi:predicted RNase H-like HicB family nuclease